MGARITAGIVGAVIAGLVLGVMMQMMGLLTDLSGMMGMESVAVGWIIHLMMSVIFGVIYGLVALWASTKLGTNLGLGAAYGVAIWIVGPLLVMPMMLESESFGLGMDEFLMLMGHVIWGLLTGAITVAVYRRLAPTSSQSVRQPV